MFSNEDLFQVVQDLITRLELGGHTVPATQLREGFQCINGLTDGWGLFFESIEAIQASDAQKLQPGDREVLEMIRKTVYAMIFR